MTRRLTLAEWEAIYEALGFRLADELEDTTQPSEVYQSARQKVAERLGGSVTE